MMAAFTGFSLKPRPGETVTVFSKGETSFTRLSCGDDTEDVRNAIKRLLMKCDQVAVIQRDQSRGGRVIGFRVTKRKRR